MQEILSFLEKNHEIMSLMITFFSVSALILSLYATKKQYQELRRAEREYVTLLKKEQEFLMILSKSEKMGVRKEIASKYFAKPTFDEKVFTRVFLELDDSEKNLLQSAVFQKADKNRKAYFEHLVDIAKKDFLTHS
ncbi:hypothetical protein [uncultured Acinetobacter sp.]|uniref:hypothetical protein n=1 Tax=uncultured Acinetobacter sp. TaxID=165433 RepID=UPI003748DE1F